MLLNQAIVNRAQASSSNIANWSFQREHKLLLNGYDFEVYLGQIKYDNPLYEYAVAIQIRGWVFALERMFPQPRLALAPRNDAEVWFIVGFNQRHHYTFNGTRFPATTTPTSSTPTDDMITALLEYVTQQFLPIFFPEDRSIIQANSIWSKHGLAPADNLNNC